MEKELKRQEVDIDRYPQPLQNFAREVQNTGKFISCFQFSLYIESPNITQQPINGNNYVNDMEESARSRIQSRIIRRSSPIIR